MILKYLSQNRSQFVEQLKALVRFPSVSTQPEHRRDVLACADWLARHFRTLGLEVKLYPTKGNTILHARTPPAARANAPEVIVYAHYNVEPPGPIDRRNTQ